MARTGVWPLVLGLVALYVLLWFYVLGLVVTTAIFALGGLAAYGVTRVVRRNHASTTEGAQ